MSLLQKKFISVEEARPGEKWLNFFKQVDQSYLQWFLKEGDFNRPTLEQCQKALQTYMPELVPMWQHLCTLTQADDELARMLSLYCPTPYISGCSQAVWNRYSPVLVRNYDYNPELCEGRIQKSKWHDTQVIASTDCLWGLLDGMNEHGLCVSLTYGGTDTIGKGFGIPIILRYILEFCKTTQEAIEVLQRIPTNMAYNITLVDAFQHITTVELNPITPPKITLVPFAVNHQGDFDISSFALFSNSFERKQTLIDRLYDPLLTIDAFIDGFEYDPLFSNNYANNFGTLYTAVYNPYLKAMEYRWPFHIRLYQSFEYFIEQETWVSYTD